MTATWLKVLDGSALSPGDVSTAIAEGMAQAKVLRIVGLRPPGDPLRFWWTAGEVMGAHAQVLESSDGKVVPAGAGWMDVRFEPDRLDTYRHANVGQPLYTDGADFDDKQDIGLFFLEPSTPGDPEAGRREDRRDLRRAESLGSSGGPGGVSLFRRLPAGGAGLRLDGWGGELPEPTGDGDRPLS